MTALFDEPQRVRKRLSAMYSTDAHRSTPRERPTYTSLKAARLPTCDECFANQHETTGESGPRSEARVRRSFRGGPNLNLCRHHEGLWRERDKEDEPTK